MTYINLHVYVYFSPHLFCFCQRPAAVYFRSWPNSAKDHNIREMDVSNPQKVDDETGKSEHVSKPTRNRTEKIRVVLVLIPKSMTLSLTLTVRVSGRTSKATCVPWPSFTPWPPILCLTWTTCIISLLLRLSLAGRRPHQVCSSLDSLVVQCLFFGL